MEGGNHDPTKLSRWSLAVRVNEKHHPGRAIKGHITIPALRAPKTSETAAGKGSRMPNGSPQGQAIQLSSSHCQQSKWDFLRRSTAGLGRGALSIRKTLPRQVDAFAG